MQELAQQPKLFLVDPQCAIVCMIFEITDSLRRFFCAKGRNVKHYIRHDGKQIAPSQIEATVKQENEGIMQNAHGEVVRDYTHCDFENRCREANERGEYPTEAVFKMVKDRD